MTSPTPTHKHEGGRQLDPQQCEGEQEVSVKNGIWDDSTSMVGRAGQPIKKQIVHSSRTSDFCAASIIFALNKLWSLPHCFPGNASPNLPQWTTPQRRRNLVSFRSEGHRNHHPTVFCNGPEKQAGLTCLQQVEVYGFKNFTPCDSKLAPLGFFGGELCVWDRERERERHKFIPCHFTPGFSRWLPRGCCRLLHITNPPPTVIWQVRKWEYASGFWLSDSFKWYLPHKHHEWVPWQSCYTVCGSSVGSVVLALSYVLAG